MIVSYSELLTWDVCRKAYHYRFPLGLAPLQETDPIDTGSKGHKLLQHFYIHLSEGKTKDEALRLISDRAAVMLQQNKFDKNLLTAWTCILKFVNDTSFTSEVCLVENRFLLPVAKLVNIEDWPWLADVSIGFTPDVVFKRTGGFYDVEDAKFVGKAWSERKMQHFNQAKLYQIFLRTMGYNVSRSIIRFFNTTTAKHGFALAKLEPGEDKILINDFISAVSDVVAYRRYNETTQALAARRTINSNACQFCFFSYPCLLERTGKSASQVLKIEYKKSTYDYNA